MTASDYTELIALSFYDEQGTTVFSEDYTEEGRLPYASLWGILWGVTMGWGAYSISTGVWNGLIRMFLVAFAFVVLFQLSYHQWLEYVVHASGVAVNKDQVLGRAV